MVDYTLTDEQKALRELADDFATKENIGARGRSRRHDLAHRRRGRRSPRRRGGSTIACELGLEKVMFEAADPEVFGWYIKNCGPQVSLVVDDSQIVRLECLRHGAWGTMSLWGRVVTYPGG
jgi:phosphosulfolactate synthase (CoM biosynthesis protein A)